MADPKVGTGKKPKGSGRRYIQMKIQETLLKLSMRLWAMLKKALLNLTELKTHMLAKFKS